ncbi:hypothetical protein [Vampirovibrio chlorellavorus]|uniref:hypothetical protein n=1 Tax=Vampirovibrio chlorellavorus TaxID=758823 RepID=UPI0026EA22FF|nr:hypothetical protein [Vampirovibrio chlorellavorus]
MGCVSPAGAVAVDKFQLREPVLLQDPARKPENLAEILWRLHSLAEQQALRSRMLFPREILETDVPLIDPRRSSVEVNGL